MKVIVVALLQAAQGVQKDFGNGGFAEALSATDRAIDQIQALTPPPKFAGHA